MSKKFLSVFLALVMAFALFPITGAAEGDVPEFSDMPVGGAGEALQFAVDNGLLNGYDGKIMPYDPLTRAQMAAIMARAFGATEKADVSGYTDLVGVDEWIVDSMAKALKMGIMQGYDNKMDPNGYITREQAFVVLARALKLEPSATSRKWYSDADELSEWAKGYVFTLVNAGYITGTGDTLNPKDYITRADFAQLMYNTVKQFINVPGEYTKVADGNVVVNVPDVTLKNVTINGDLIVGDGVGEGDLTLDNVVVKGRMLVRGGGIESIVIVGGGVEGKVIVAKADGNVRVVVDGADVEVVVIDDGKNEVVIEGTVGAVDINASDVPVAIRGGKVGEVKVSCEGSAVITVADDAEVGSIAVADSAEGTSIFVKGSVAEIETSAANTMVYGSGEVGTVSVGSTADNTSVTTPNTVINNGGASGVTAAGGKEVPVVGSVQNNATGTNIVTSPAPSDGGETGTTPTPTPTPQPQPIPQVPAGPVVVPVYGVRIEGTPELRQVLTAVVNPSSATVKYQWLRSDNGVNFEEIEGATGRTYTLTNKDVGKYIKVKVTGVQFYFGTAESTSFGPVTAGEEPEPVASTYKFSYEVPDKVFAGESYTVPVTIEPETEGTVGYDRVRFDVKVTTPDGATLQLLAEDTNGVVHDVAQIGYWGPENGFPIGPDYKATTTFTAIFSAEGEYTITFSLVDLDIDRALVTQVVEVTVGAPLAGAFGKNAVTTKKHGAVDGYIVDIRLTDGATFSGAQVEVSLVDADGNVMQKNTLKEGHGITGTSLTCPFDVRGSFDYQDGSWQVDGSVYGKYETPAKVVIKVVLANGKVLVDELTSITPIPLAGAFGKNAVTTKKHGDVDGYIVDIRLTDGVTFSGAQVEVSLVAADGNVMQKNTLKENHGITGTSLTCPFDVRGSFNYQDGSWQVEGSVKGNYTPPAKVVIKVVLANGKVLEDELTSITPIPLAGAFGKNAVTTKKHGVVDGYIVDIRLTDGVTFSGAQVEVSLVDAKGNVMQKNTLKEDHDITGTSLTCPFDVRGSFNYQGGHWQVDGSVYGKFETPAMVVIKVVLANGKELVDVLTGITPISQDIQVSGITVDGVAATVDTGNEEGLDVTPLENAIKAAIAAKEGAVVSEDGKDMPAGTYWVTQADMDALDAAIASAEAAKKSAETQQDVDDAAAELEVAIAAFNEAKREAVDEEEIEESGQGEEPVEGEEPAADKDPLIGEEPEE